MRTAALYCATLLLGAPSAAGALAASPASSRLLGAPQPPPLLHRLRLAPSVVMMAKKKKGKVPAAAKALEALEAWEAGNFPGSAVADEDDGLTPVTVTKKKKAGKAKKSNLAPAAQAALEALEAMEAAATEAGAEDPLAPVAPTMGKKMLKRKAGVEETAAPEPAAVSQPASSAPTLADKVRAACEQLGVDASQPVPAALKACNEAMGIQGSGPLLQQADELVAQLGLNLLEGPAAASGPAAVPAASPMHEEEVLVADSPAEKAAVNEAPVADSVDEAMPREVTLSKKKQGKPKTEQVEDDDVEEESARPAGTDQSGRRGMQTRIQRFDEAEPGFAYVKMNGGKLRFRNQDVCIFSSLILWALSSLGGVVEHLGAQQAKCPARHICGQSPGCGVARLTPPCVVPT